MDKNMPTQDPMSEGSDAGDALAAPPQVGDSSPITVPVDMLPGCKVGDTYTVKSVDGDNATLESASSDSGDTTEQWGKDAIAHVNSKGGQNA
jgi:hypothetical protein